MLCANRHFLPDHVWHITHRCHQREFLLKFARARKRYRFEDMMTPCENLKSLPNASGFLKPGMSFEALDGFTAATSDTRPPPRSDSNLNWN